MLKNFKLVIEYDGTDYHGWQRQKDSRTVQGTIEGALETMTGHSVVVIGSGRTDAGVHALNQVANFLVDTRLTADIFKKGLNSLLPGDIVIKDCKEVDDRRRGSRMFLFAQAKDFTINKPERIFKKIWQNGRDNQLLSLLN